MADKKYKTFDELVLRNESLYSVDELLKLSFQHGPKIHFKMLGTVLMILGKKLNVLHRKIAVDESYGPRPGAGKTIDIDEVKVVAQKKMDQIERQGERPQAERPTDAHAKEIGAAAQRKDAKRASAPNIFDWEQKKSEPDLSAAARKKREAEQKEPEGKVGKKGVYSKYSRSAKRDADEYEMDYEDEADSGLLVKRKYREKMMQMKKLQKYQRTGYERETIFVVYMREYPFFRGARQRASSETLRSLVTKESFDDTVRRVNSIRQDLNKRAAESAHRLSPEPTTLLEKVSVRLSRLERSIAKVSKVVIDLLEEVTKDPQRLRSAYSQHLASEESSRALSYLSSDVEGSLGFTTETDTDLYEIPEDALDTEEINFKGNELKEELLGIFGNKLKNLGGLDDETKKHANMLDYKLTFIGNVKEMDLVLIENELNYHAKVHQKMDHEVTKQVEENMTELETLKNTIKDTLNGIEEAIANTATNTEAIAALHEEMEKMSQQNQERWSSQKMTAGTQRVDCKDLKVLTEILKQVDMIKCSRPAFNHALDQKAGLVDIHRIVTYYQSDVTYGDLDKRVNDINVKIESREHHWQNSIDWYLNRLELAVDKPVMDAFTADVWDKLIKLQNRIGSLIDVFNDLPESERAKVDVRRFLGLTKCISCGTDLQTAIEKYGQMEGHDESEITRSSEQTICVHMKPAPKKCVESGVCQAWGRKPCEEKDKFTKAMTVHTIDVCSHLGQQTTSNLDLSMKKKKVSVPCAPCNEHNAPTAITAPVWEDDDTEPPAYVRMKKQPKGRVLLELFSKKLKPKP